MKRKVSWHRICSAKVNRPLRLLVAADLHSGPYEDLEAMIPEADAVLLPGDLVDRHHRDNRRAEQFLRDVPGRIPVFYALGNHELGYPRQEELRSMMQDSAAVVLNNECAAFEGISIGGVTGQEPGPESRAFLDAFEKEESFKLLMCHHPEMYRDGVRGRAVDFTVCGHAHGGQMQFFGRGLYAPGQGFFPKLTHGLYDGGKMMVSRGMTNTVRVSVPRINNPCELIVLELAPESAYP